MPSLKEIGQYLGLPIVGDENASVDGLASLSAATSRHISFCVSENSAPALQKTKAVAVILPESIAHYYLGNKIIVDQPLLVFAQLTQWFDDSPRYQTVVHASAVIESCAVIDSTVSVGAHVYIGKGVRIGQHCVIEANTVICDNTTIGDHCRLRPNVTVYHNVTMGDHVTIHSGAVIGGDGFGNVPTGEQTAGYWQKIYQLGSVRIGSRVEIGNNTCIDRGALDDTVIDDDVIIDNLVHVAHNCHIGQATAIAGCSGMAGSTVIGKRCQLAGFAALGGHMSLADDVHIAGQARVTSSIKKPGLYSSGTVHMNFNRWKKNAVRFTQLDDMKRAINRLEKRLNVFENDSKVK